MLALACMGLAAHAAEPSRAQPGVPLDDDALGQVHAAGLQDGTLQALGQGSADAVVGLENALAALKRLQEQGQTVDRQQALDQLRLATGAVALPVGAAQGAVTLTGFVPLAAITMPALAIPLFPFFMPPSPQEPPKH